MREDDRPIGTLAPGFVFDASIEYEWAVILQAREDTDGNGRLAIYQGHHGGLSGDRPTSWLVLRGGRELSIRALLDVSPNRRRVIVEHEGRALVLDTVSDERWNLGPLVGAVAFDPVWPARGYRSLRPEARFLDDDRVVWLPSRHRVEVCDLRGGANAALAEETGWIAHMEVDEGWVLLNELAEDPEDPSDSELLPHFRARGGPAPCGGICEGPPTTRIAIRVATGQRFSNPEAELFARSWGYGRLDADGTLRIHTIEGDDRVVGTGCGRGSFVMIGGSSPTVLQECELGEPVRVAMRGARTPVAVEPLGEPVGERLSALGVQDMQWGFRHDGERVWISGLGEALSGSTVIANVASGPIYTDLLADRVSHIEELVVETEDEAFLWDEERARWVRLRVPPLDRACLHRDRLSFELWGRCVRLPEDTEVLIGQRVLPDGRALLRRTSSGERSSSIIGPSQLVWGRLRL